MFWRKKKTLDAVIVEEVSTKKKSKIKTWQKVLAFLGVSAMTLFVGCEVRFVDTWVSKSYAKKVEKVIEAAEGLYGCRWSKINSEKILEAVHANSEIICRTNKNLNKLEEKYFDELLEAKGILNYLKKEKFKEKNLEELAEFIKEIRKIKDYNEKTINQFETLVYLYKQDVTSADLNKILKSEVGGEYKDDGESFAEEFSFYGDALNDAALPFDFIKKSLDIQKFEMYELLFLHFKDPSLAKTKDFKKILEEKSRVNNTYVSKDDLLNAITLDLTLTELKTFKDTSKPNAIFVIGDRIKIGSRSFSNDYSYLIKKDFSKPRHFPAQLVKNAYDVYFVFAKNEKDVYDAIDKIPNVELLFFKAHGNTEALAYKGSMGFYGGCSEEENLKCNDPYCLDKTDTEIKDYIAKLNKNCIICLDSCNIAQGGKENKDNLFNFLNKYSDGRKIIASSGRSYGFEINSIYPFDAELKAYDGKTITNK